MSLTPLMWRALERTQNQFRFMSTYPIEFDPVKQRYMKNDISVKLVPWVISVALLFTVTFVPCAILVLAQVQGFVSIPLTKFAVVAIFLAISGLCCLVDRTKVSIENKNPDILGISLNAVVTVFTIYPYIFPVFFLYTQMDPLYQFEKYLLTEYAHRDVSCPDDNQKPGQIRYLDLGY
ncbi:hypothetical protein Fcan01_10158 [Folsomia candida]|uniref:Uncharacterized protein n=1 Tax=Folsomia candida TaxID=158441 RepID=A0A226E9Z7_FOLCA|nr:hypothetical protein Fcan01_10158 [Folsomia candida]